MLLVKGCKSPKAKIRGNRIVKTPKPVYLSGRSGVETGTFCIADRILPMSAWGTTTNILNITASCYTMSKWNILGFKASGGGYFISKNKSTGLRQRTYGRSLVFSIEKCGRSIPTTEPARQSMVKYAIWYTAWTKLSRLLALYRHL